MARDRLGIGGDTGLAAYLDGLLAPGPPLRDLYAEMAGDDWGVMATHPDLGRLLALLVRLTGGRRVLEIGTFVGTSAIWMAGGLAAGGAIDSLEADLERAARARGWFARAGVGDRVTVHVGDALATLPRLPDGAYDLAYVDADKTGYPAYVDHCIRLVRPGGVIVADNVLADGGVARPPRDDDARTAALRAATARLMDDPRVASTVLLVGDGITLSVRV